MLMEMVILMRMIMGKLLPSSNTTAAATNQIMEGTSVLLIVSSLGSLHTIVDITRITFSQIIFLHVQANAEVLSANVSEEENLIFK